MDSRIEFMNEGVLIGGNLMLTTTFSGWKEVM